MSRRGRKTVISTRAKAAAGLAIVVLLLVPALGAQGTDKPAGGRGLLGLDLSAEGDRALVVAVVPEGPGAKAGLAAGDLIVAFNGTGFRFMTDRQLIEGLGWVRSGRPVRLTVLRGDSRREVLVTPRPASAEEQRTLDLWLAGQRLEEERQRRERAEAEFEAIVRQTPVNITFRRTATGNTMSSETLLPPGLDLRNRILDALTGALHVGDQMVIRYSWDRAVNALKMDVTSSPRYVDLDAVIGLLRGARNLSGTKP